jgi:hypothetical protein
LLVLASLLFCPGSNVQSTHTHQPPESRQQAALTHQQVLQQPTAPRRKEASSAEQQALRKRNFEPFARLLRRQELPFEPEVLLQRDWPKKLAPFFEQMPDMQETRYLAEPLAGVQLADTLYLPERVELVGDTVILVRHLRWEGTEVVIKGNHRIALYPAVDASVLGTALPRKWKQKEGPVAEMIVDIPESLPPTQKGHITIDTSGRGYQEWLESIGGEAKLKEVMKALYSKEQRVREEAKLEFDRLRRGTGRELEGINEDRDTSGAEGGIGDIGTPGSEPAQPNPLVQPQATGGDCNGDLHGQPGIEGAKGGDAGAAGEGKIGKRGGDATIQDVNIPDGDANTWNLMAHGGQGGEGGPGGIACDGAKGGTGGKGGDGAFCHCLPGGVGNGGQGGKGGTGGRGGRGARGGMAGPGGNGGTINVSKPCAEKFRGTINVNVNKGGSGEQGDGSPSGMGGQAGTPGQGGKGGSSISCSTHSGSPGGPGLAGDPGGTWAAGDPGPVNPDGGQDGKYNPTVRACDDDCEELACDPPVGQNCLGPTDYCTWPATGCDPDMGNVMPTPWGCCCVFCPVFLDIDGDGGELTSAVGGVRFDGGGDGRRDKVSWTLPDSDDAWLVLDRNNNGVIDSGLEVFGNFTEQPASDQANGFRALAVFDQPANGGNGDGFIDAQDRTYQRLRLWQDRDHDGVSESGEMFRLAQLDVARISLQYVEGRRQDQHGNIYSHGARIYSRQQSLRPTRYAYDVFLLVDNRP